MSDRRDVYVKPSEVRLVLVATDVRGRSDSFEHDRYQRGSA
jgi:hypothetical protein